MPRPAPLIYLPVQPVYRSPGPVLRLGDAGAGRLCIEADSERDDYLEAKKDTAGLWHVAENSDYRALLEDRLCSWLRDRIESDQPGLDIPAGGTLDSLIAGIQEDVVFMHRENSKVAAFRAIAVYLNVSFASGWCPECNAGRDFRMIHSPVRPFDRFMGPDRVELARLLFGDDRIVRFVWGLSPTPDLDRRKCSATREDHVVHRSAPVVDWRDAKRAWLRVERQVVWPIDSNTSCFFIRVYRYPVSSLDEDVRTNIRSSIEAMPPEFLQYKGYNRALEHILSLV